LFQKPFINLHCHNEFSIRDGIGTADEHVKWAVDHNVPACSLTNHGNVSVYFRQYQACKEAGIKPIFGAELYIINDRSKLIPWIGSKQEDAVEKRKEATTPRSHILLIAKNYTGLKNLFRITSQAYIESFYRFPLIDFRLLSEHKEGIIVSTACCGGELAKMSMEDRMEEADAYIEKYKNEFGDDFYIELMSIDYPHQWEVNKRLWELSQKHNVKTIVTTDAHYLYPEDQKVHEAMLLLQSKKTYTIEDNEEPKELSEDEVLESENEKLWEFTVKDLYLKTLDNIYDDYKKGKFFGEEPLTYSSIASDRESYKALHSCLQNTWEVYEKVECFDIDTTIKIPKLYENEEKVLFEKIEKGYHHKISVENDEDHIYWDRLMHEYEIIVKMEFVSYFLILEDLMSWVHKSFGRETVGVGRGSAGGSLINYCVDITDIDPIKHGLLFERFIDVGRKDLPDVDMDFEPRIRENVKQYLIDKYGTDKVVSIGNYQLSKVKNAIKDAARIYNIDFLEVNKVTNAIPDSDYIDGDKEFIDHFTYEQLVEKYDDLKKFFEKYPDVDRLFKRLRNSIRSIGKHAAGVVVSSVPLNNWIPLMRSKGHIITCNTEGGDYHELTDQGFVKYDILGLNNLQVVNDTCKLIKERCGKEINWNHIDIDSKEAYYLARSGDTTGVFQFESNLATSTCIAVRPDCFNDLSAINSIIRPGPLNMQMDKQFAIRKRTGQYEIHPSYAHIMKDTYGILVYQEQFMRCFSELGEFNVTEVNKARKDISKKESSKEAEDNRFERIRSWKWKFIANASKKMPEKTATDLWNLIESFGKYGFNKSHSDAYTYTSFRELWLKAHYGIEFYCTLLNNTEKSKEDKNGASTLAKYISHINTNPIYFEDGKDIKKRDKTSVLHVDINRSEIAFSITPEGIRFGLGFIKGISDDAARCITEVRPFQNIDSIIDSDNKWIKNKRTIIALIKSGALDSISNGMSREELYNYFIQKRKYKEDPVNWSLSEIIENETEYTKISFTEIDYFIRLKNAIKTKFGEKVPLKTLEESGELRNDGYLPCLFRIIATEKKKTKTHKKYYVLTLSDGVSSLGRVYYWPYNEKEPLSCDNAKISENAYYGVVTKKNNYYNVEKIKFVRAISS